MNWESPLHIVMTSPLFQCALGRMQALLCSPAIQGATSVSQYRQDDAPPVCQVAFCDALSVRLQPPAHLSIQHFFTLRWWAEWAESRCSSHILHFFFKHQPLSLSSRMVCPTPLKSWRIDGCWLRPHLSYSTPHTRRCPSKGRGQLAS